MRHRTPGALLIASFLYLLIANLIWIARDTRPPFWDMAVHQRSALSIYEAAAGSGIAAISAIPHLTGDYPPLYHVIVAIFYAIFGKSVDAAQWANLPAIALLGLATYKLARPLLSPPAAAAAAALVNFYPYLLWLSRETLIDYWLAAIVALSMWALIRTKEFSDRKASILFGIACGLGLLTKWTFPFFVLLPAVWLARKHLRNAMLAAAVAAVIAAYWYVPSAGALSEFLKTNAAGGMTEGDPARFSAQAFIFYIRALEGYQLFLPLFAAFIAGAILLVGNFRREWIPVVLWLAGGWLGLMLFQNKDPRYSAPLLPAVALITAQLIQKKHALLYAMVPLVLFQHYLVSFGVPFLPPAVVLANGTGGPIPWDWNLYTQTHHDLWGPPAREDWRIRHVLERVGSIPGRSARLGMVPDIPRFDTSAFEFYIALSKAPVTITRVGTLDAGAIANNDFILVSEQDRGWAFARQDPAINAYVFGHPELFRMVESFSLPNGDVIRLYKVGSA